MSSIDPTPGRALILSLLLVTACGGDTPAGSTGPESGTPGPLTVTFAAEGNGYDPDGFTLALDGEETPAAPDVSLSWTELPAGTHVLRVTRLAPHCHSYPDSLAVRVGADLDATGHFLIRCYGDLAFSGYLPGPVWQVFYMGRDGAITQLTDGPRGHFVRGWSPDGSRILYGEWDQAPHSDFFSVAPDGTDPLQLTTGGWQNIDPVWSPDGTQIAYYRYLGPYGGFETRTVSLDGSNDVPLFPTPDEDLSPSWATDGGSLLLASHRFGHRWDLIRKPLGGGGPTFIASGTALQSVGADPAGNFAAVMSFENAQQHISYVRLSDGVTIRFLPKVSTIGYAWAPTGHRIAIFSVDSGGYSLDLTSVATPSDRVRLTKDPGLAAWSPDGALIGYDSYDTPSGLNEMFVATPDGVMKQRIASGDYAMVGPLWRPTARPGATSTRWPAPRRVPAPRPVQAAAGLAPGPVHPVVSADGCIDLPGESSCRLHP